jgi:hypothetical protein
MYQQMVDRINSSRLDEILTERDGAGLSNAPLHLGPKETLMIEAQEPHGDQQEDDNDDDLYEEEEDDEEVLPESPEDGSESIELDEHVEVPSAALVIAEITNNGRIVPRNKKKWFINLARFQVEQGKRCPSCESDPTIIEKKIYHGNGLSHHTAPGNLFHTHRVGTYKDGTPV